VPVIGGACAGAPGFIEIPARRRGAYMSPRRSSTIRAPRCRPMRKDRPKSRQAALLGPRPTTSSIPTSTASRKSGVTNAPTDLAADRDKMRECLGQLKGFPGVAGEITMDGCATAPARARSSGRQRPVRQRREVELTRSCAR